MKTVTQGVAVQLVISCTYSLSMCMSLRYEPTDPYVVRATFFTDTDEPAEWVLGRDLLADGLRGFRRLWGHPDLAGRRPW
ncbi:SsgA family sporulation/cell division regulator [Streptomyces mirabilis]|uniref:SsgA family sporulation/cell division regulator n=1 Tax=Streptomyces mirabilis TaxID=68239 RepID=UPI00332CFFEE